MAQKVTGTWKTIDDETGKPKSLVEISEKDGKLFGTIIKLFREEGEDPDPICDDCEDDRKDQKVIGMEIIRNMVKDGDEWEDGTICDPKNGKVYDCKLWIDEDNPKQLNVRGYIAFFYRTQYWQKVD
jgi:uncharacterized protein (DUF2147 family)